LCKPSWNEPSSWSSVVFQELGPEWLRELLAKNGWYFENPAASKMRVLRFWFWEFWAYQLKHCLNVRIIRHQCILFSMHNHFIHQYSYHNLWFVILALDRDLEIAIHFQWIMIAKMNMCSITILKQHNLDNNYSLTLN
jgi:hypothetical protein